MSKKRVFGGVGHGGSDPGAAGNGLKEADINLDIALAWKEDLERHEVEVKLSRYKNENDNVDEEVRECNAFNPDIAIDFHTNSGGGDGFEIFHSIVGGLGKTLAQNIEKEVIALGQNSRGVKTKKNSSGNDYYGFIRNTKCHANIMECAFIDNSKDIAIVDTKAEREAFGRAVAKGTLKTLGIAYKELPKPTDKPKEQKYAVLINSYGDITKAEGISCMLKCKDNLYSEVIPYKGKYAIKIYPLSPISKAESAQKLVKEKYNAYSDIIKL